MHCRRFQEKFTEFADHTLPTSETTELRAHLAACPDCEREWQAWQQFTAQVDQLTDAPAPSPRLRENFYAMLESAESIAPTANPFALPRSRLEQFFAALLPARPSLQAAAALFVFATGLFLGRAHLTSSTAPSPSPDNSAKEEIATLRAQVGTMGRLASYSLLQQRSTGERLRAVLSLRNQPQLDRVVLTDLVSTLALDPSVNVRLSTLDALADHASDPLVRAGLLAVLPREPAPLVQLALIDLLADTGDASARPAFEILSRDAAADANVRAAARDALLSLGQNTGRPPAHSSSVPL